MIYAPECPIRLISPQQLHIESKAKGNQNSSFTTEENTATLFHGGYTFACDYHNKTKIPTLCCITDKNKKTTYKKMVASTLAQQPSYKGRKRVIFNETNNTIAPAAYTSNMNTTQQELLRLHET
jgi:hypothetical protein